MVSHKIVKVLQTKAFSDVWFSFHTEIKLTNGFMKFVDFDFIVLQPPKQIATKCKGQIRSIQCVDNCIDDLVDKLILSF